MRRWLPLAAYFTLALGATAMALGGVGREPGARAAVVAASGAFEVANSRGGQPIFAASGIAPGQSESGTVTIENTGAAPAELVLAMTGLTDAPGAGGGLLSSRLELRVVDVSRPATPLAVYEGPLASMPDRPAGRLEPGESRTFEFAATLPEAGTRDLQNEVQGGSTAVAYSWTAAEAGEDDEASEGSTPGGAGPGGTSFVPAPGAGGGAGGGDGAGPASPGLELALTRVRRTVGAGRLLVWAGCDQSCAIRVRGRLRAVAGNRHRGARLRLVGGATYRTGSQRLRIAVPRKLRRWAAAQPQRTRLRARLVLSAHDPGGERDVLRRTLRLRIPPRR